MDRKLDLNKIKNKISPTQMSSKEALKDVNPWINNIDDKIIVDEELEDYIDRLVKDGYIMEDGTPLKCVCGCTDFEQSGEYYDEHSIIEYALNCKACGAQVGYWSYGNWDI